jgi:hypothetical protein
MENACTLAHCNIEQFRTLQFFVAPKTICEVKTVEFLEEDCGKKSYPQIGHPTIGGCKNERRQQSCWSDVGVL